MEHYASTDISYVPVSVCLSVTRWYCIERTAGIELFLAYEHPSTYPSCFKGN